VQRRSKRWPDCPACRKGDPWELCRICLGVGYYLDYDRELADRTIAAMKALRKSCRRVWKRWQDSLSPAPPGGDRPHGISYWINGG